MTFSIAARCAETGAFGVAISSSSPAVAARCAYARAGAGAVCSQNVTDPRLGPVLLERMAAGQFASEALDQIVATAPQIAYRQVTAIDRWGDTASFSGDKTLGVFATVAGPDAVAAGNLLAAASVPEAMVEGFAAKGGALGDRLVAALAAGLAAGGEAGPVRSAGLLLVHEVEWPVADLRVDWADDPIGDLAALWRLWRPQLEDYVARALRPDEAPRYGVPGDS